MGSIMWSLLAHAMRLYSRAPARRCSAEPRPGEFEKEMEPWTSYFLISLGVDDSVNELGSWYHHITYCPALMDALDSEDPTHWLIQRSR